MNKNPSLVHFFGPDGAGKSVQADILVSLLDRRGLKVRKCWVRAHHTLAFVLWKLLVRIGFYRTVSNSFGVVTKLPAIDRSRFLRGFWSLVEFVSVLPIVLRVRLSILRGYRIVAERYVLDTTTSIAYVINDIGFLRSRISVLLFSLIPKNTVFIFLDSDYETIFKRRTPYPVSENYPQKQENAHNNLRESSVEPSVFIEFQRIAYRILASHFNALVIDTSKNSVEETSEIVRQYLELV